MENENKDRPLKSQETNQPAQEPITSTIEQPKPETQKKDKKNLKVAIYVVVSITLLTLCAFGFWFYQEKIAKRPSGAIPSALPTTFPTVKVEPSVTTPIFFQQTCKQLKGQTCINNASQTCQNNQWIFSSDTDFCCASSCVSTPICPPNQPWSSDCRCPVNPQKDNIAVVIKKDGELDVLPVNNTIENYLNAASLRTEKKSAGLKRFSGTTFQELSSFVERLYQEDGVGSLILVGRDLPIFQDLGSEIISLNEDKVTKLSFIEREIEVPVGLSTNCRDVVLSFIVPRFANNKDYSAVEFVKNSFNNFTDYHTNKNSKRTQFKKESLEIRWDNTIDDACGVDSSRTSSQSTLPSVMVLNTQHKTIKELLKQKFAFLDIGVHGSVSSQGLGLTSYPDGDNSCSSIYISPRDLETYSLNNPESFLIVDSSACGSITLSDLFIDDCCFPQKYLEIGAWSYSSLGGSEHHIRNVYNMSLSGETLADGIRKIPVQATVFGDILSGL